MKQKETIGLIVPPKLRHENDLNGKLAKLLIKTQRTLPFLAFTGDTALPAHSFTESAGTSQYAVLQMPQYREHCSAGRLWQAAKVTAHLHALMGFYCALRGQIKKQYLLIWGRTKERSASGTNTTPLPHTLKHSFEFFNLECF